MPQHLLVVDDHAQITNMLRQYLEAQGYAVAVAGDGVEALERLAERLPDLILLDVMMPRMDGFEFMQELRREHAVPVIFLTARMDEIDLLTGFGYGADDYLTKPFSMSELGRAGARGAAPHTGGRLPGRGGAQRRHRSGSRPL